MLVRTTAVVIGASAPSKKSGKRNVLFLAVEKDKNEIGLYESSESFTAWLPAVIADKLRPIPYIVKINISGDFVMPVEINIDDKVYSLTSKDIKEDTADEYEV